MKKFSKTLISLTLVAILISSMCLNVYAYQADMKSMSYQYGNDVIRFYGRLYVFDVGEFYGSSLAEGTAETQITYKTSNVTYMTVTYQFELDWDPSLAQHTHRTSTVSGSSNLDTGTYDDPIEAARCDRLVANHKVRYRVGGGKYMIWDVNTIEEGVFFP